MSRLAADWRTILTWSSVRLHLVAVAIGLIYEAMPVLDPSIAGMLPAPMQAKAIGVYAIGSLILRVTRQKSNG